MVRKWGWWQRPSSPSFTHTKCITPDSSAAHYVVALKQWNGDSKGQGRMSRPYPIYFSIPSFLPRVFHMSTFPCVVFPSSYPETFQVDNPYRAFVTMEEDYYVKLTWNTRTTIPRLSTAQLTTMIYPMRRRRRCSLSLYSVARCWIPGKNCTTPPLD